MARFGKGKAGQVPHTSAPDLYHYQPGIKIMSDNVLTWAFDSPQTLPLLVFRGAGRVAGMLGVLANAPQVVAPLAIPTNSFGGLQTGGIQFSPLEGAD